MGFISEQIEKGITVIQAALVSAKSEKTPDQILEEVQELENDRNLENS